MKLERLQNKQAQVLDTKECDIFLFCMAARKYLERIFCDDRVTDPSLPNRVGWSSTQPIS